MRRWALLAYPLTAAMAVAVYYATGHVSYLFNAIGLSSPVVIVVAVKMHRPEQRAPWFWFAVGQLFFVAGDLYSYNYEKIVGRSLPYPAVSDVLYLLVYPCLVVGLVLLIRRRSPGRDWPSLIDALVIAIGVGTLSWIFLIAPYAHSSLPLLQKLTSMAYPIADLLLVATVVRLAVGPGKRSRAFLLMLGAVLTLFATDTIYGWTLLSPHPYVGGTGYLEIGWAAFYVLFGTAALHPSMHRLSDRAPETDHKPTWPRIVVLGVASLLAPAAQAIQYVRHQPVDVLVIFGTTATLFTLVMLRMAGLVREQRRSAFREQALALESASLTKELLLRQSEERFASLIRHASDVVTVIDLDTTIRYASPSAEQVLGFAPSEIEGTSFAALVHEADRTSVLPFLTAVGDGAGHTGQIDFRMRRSDGSWVSVESLRTNLLDDPAVKGIVLNTRDISERKEFEEQLAHQAFHDDLTGLANRALFRDRVTHALERRQRDHHPVAVIFMDLDDFKAINDSLGHAVGDQVLRQVGERVRRTLRPADTSARLGGDEFAVLLEEAGDGVHAAEVAERIMQALKAPLHLDGTQVSVRASLGIAIVEGTAPTGDDGAEMVLRNADVAMYMAKENSKGRYQVFEPAMHDAVLRRQALKADLQRAVEEGEFELHYQPIIELETGRVWGVEALIRWIHPVRGMIPPLDFIPLAEETGLIVPIGSWVLREACRYGVALQAEFPSTEPFHMSVNLSARQLQRSGIVEDVAEIVRLTGIDPATLILELTESVMMADMDLSIERLVALKALGVRLAIDDFGTGYSSLNHLRRFPVDILKVDKSFIDGVADGGESSALTAAVIELAGILRLTPIAEGIERADQLQRLLELHCELGQGYLFAKPLRPPELTSLLTERRQMEAEALALHRGSPA